MAAHWMSWVAIDVCHSLPHEAQGEREGEVGRVGAQLMALGVH